MNKTYRILPSAEDMLLRLLRGLALTDEERAALRACVLRHVEVSAADNTWELVIGCSEVLDDGLIVRMKEQIAANYQLREAHIQQNAVSLSHAVVPLWERIVSAAVEGDAVLFHTLRQTAYAIDGNVIRLSAPGNFGAELFAPIFGNHVGTPRWHPYPLQREFRGDTVHHHCILCLVFQHICQRAGRRRQRHLNDSFRVVFNPDVVD